VCVEIGTPVRLGDRPQHPLDTRGDAGFVGRALKDRRLDAGAGDAFLDVPNEQLRHRLGAVKHGARPGEVEVHRHVVVGVHPGGNDNVELGGRRDARDVSAKPDDGEIDDAVHAARLQLVEATDRIGLATGFLTPDLGIVLHNLGRQHEYMLVHQRDAQVGRVDCAPRSVQLCHGRILLRHRLVAARH